MVIIMRCDDWEIDRVLIDKWSYVYIFYWDAFETPLLDLDGLKDLQGLLVALLGKQVQVKVI